LQIATAPETNEAFRGSKKLNPDNMKNIIWVLVALIPLTLSCKKQGCKDSGLYQGRFVYDEQLDIYSISFLYSSGYAPMVIDSFSPSISDPELANCKCENQVCFDYQKTGDFYNDSPFVYQKIILTELCKTEF
jgi:hypothetical protein